MCGIAGILSFEDRPHDERRLGVMQARIALRGPDGLGRRIDGPSAMVHSRLSVVDLMSGQQPMSVPAIGEHGELTLVFNGEIYNHRELRKRLVARGHAFTSDHSDTEVLLHGYREWGLELPKHLHGMFAFAVWDAKHETLFLCRDRVGKKPLWYKREGGRLVYASLIGALLAGLERTPAIDREALSDYLTFGYTLEGSLLSGVREVPAGHWMLVGRDGRTEARSYWQLAPLSRSSTSLGAEQAIDELLNEAVSKRLESDVPLGCFLSGGVDSSLIAAIAARHLGGERLRTFNITMPDARYDEGPYARQAAEAIGARHETLAVTADVAADLPALIASSGEPTADSSILPTYWLSRAARQHVTVALSGDGGDEMFGGYERYRALRLIAAHRWWLRWMPSPAGDGAHPKSRRARLGRLIEAARPREQQQQYLAMIRLFSPQQLGWLGVRTASPADDPPGWQAELDAAEAARRWDIGHYLPFDLLRKVDRASMAVALEVRCPMLDTQVMDLAAHLPLGVLMPGSRTKGLLRRVAMKYLPPAIVHRRKMGFAAPIGDWFRGPLESMLRGWLLKRDHLETLGFRLSRVDRLIGEHRAGAADHTHRLFALLSLSIWLGWLKDPGSAARLEVGAASGASG